MPLIFSDILTHLNTTFKEDWLEDYFEENEAIIDENQAIIQSKVDELTNITIDVFYKSLIAGEYTLETKNIITEIEELKIKSNLLLNTIPGNNFDSQEFLLATLKKGYIDILKVYSNLYLNFIKLVQSQNENPNIDIIYEAHFDTVKFFNEVYNSKRKKEIAFYNSIIYLYRVDHFFNDDASMYRIINQLENSIKEHQLSKYFILIKEKLNFLKFKWEIRQKSFKNRDFKVSKAYIIDDELFISTDDIKYNPSLSKLQNWKEYIECYYEVDDWKSKLSSFTNNFKHESYNTLSSLKLILLLKYYKDVNKDYRNLKEVVKEFEHRYKENSTSEQRFIYNKTYLYALNNQFSFLLKQKELEEVKVKKLKEKIEKIQKKCNIDNFFTESKYITYKLNLLESKFQNRQKLEHSIKDKDELDTLLGAVKLYKEKLKWSKNNHNLLFQLPYEECLIDSNVDELDIFYASSIVLPLPHEESENNYEEISEKLKGLKQLILSVAALNKEFTTIKELQSEIKTNQVKTLETIGVFTAIMAFILASIPSFSFVNEFYQALLFTGIIGSCLLIMVSTIFLFTRGFKKIQSWLLIVLSIALFSFTLYSLNRSIDMVEISIKQDFSKKINSLKVEQVKVDSLINSKPKEKNPTPN
ncbi:MAG TPA: hypothetical protein VLZ83_12645 [Edaphocola sp.]|nr:hypothetical protein [Edaphocola sp.]